jgi:hypothetical protein
LLAEGIFAWEEPLREGLIDDRHFGLRLVLSFPEKAASQQARTKRAEIAGADVPLRDVIVLAVPGTAQHSKPGRVPIAAERSTVLRDSCRGDAGQAFRLGGDQTSQRDCLRILAVGRIGCRDIDRHQMIGIDA